jgi:hypothetical protein
MKSLHRQINTNIILQTVQGSQNSNSTNTKTTIAVCRQHEPATKASTSLLQQIFLLIIPTKIRSDDKQQTTCIKGGDVTKKYHPASQQTNYRQNVENYLHI